MDDRGELMKFITPLARSSPAHWRDFLEAFRVYENAAKNRCITSGSDMVFVAQGEARAVVRLSKLFEDAVNPSGRLPKQRKTTGNMEL